MKANTHSLLTSNWMITDQSENQLIPFLLNILQGTTAEISLTPTAFLSASTLGAINPFEASKPTTDKVVGIIQVHHPIFKYDQNCGPKGTQTIMSILEQWKKDENIVAVVMDYNSGGGQVSGTREAAMYINDYPKPVVSYTNDVCGSAALYLYAAGDYRIVNQYADFVGCIGTMFKSVNLEGVIEKAGGKVVEAYSDLSPEKNYQSRQLKEGNERPLIEKMLNPGAQLFHDDMKAFLPNITEKALQGDVFSPVDAVAEGLADSIGTLQDAIDKAFELSKANKTSTNSNTNTMSHSKKLPRVEAALGLEAPLAITDNGSFLQEEQLDALEASLDNLETQNSTLQTQLSEANAAKETAVNAVTAQLTEATNSLTAAEAAVDAALTNAGKPVTGTLTEKLAVLDAYTLEKGSAPGASHTNAKTDANADAKSFSPAEDAYLKAALNN